MYYRSPGFKCRLGHVVSGLTIVPSLSRKKAQYPKHNTSAPLQVLVSSF